MRRLVLSAVSLAFLAACQPATTELTEEQKAGIADTVTRIVRGIMEAAEALDHEKHIAPFSDELVSADNGSVTTNWDSIRVADREFMRSMSSVEGTFGEMFVEVLGPSAAVVTAPYEATLIDTTGTRMHVAGAGTYVFAQVAGRWRIIHMHRSMPLPQSM